MSRPMSVVEGWNPLGGGCSPAPGSPFCSSGFEVSFLSGFVNVNGSFDLVGLSLEGDSGALLLPTTSGAGELSGVDTL